MHPYFRRQFAAAVGAAILLGLFVLARWLLGYPVLPR